MSGGSLKANPAYETIQVGPVSIRFLLTGDDSRGSLAIFESVVAAGRGVAVPPHSHDAYEETVYGLQGTVTLSVGGTEVQVGPGEVFCIPRGAVHHVANHGSTDARSITIATPAAIGPEYFREVAEVLRAAAGGLPDRATMAEIMERHGLTPAPPPAETQ